MRTSIFVVAVIAGIATATAPAQAGWHWNSGCIYYEGVYVEHVDLPGVVGTGFNFPHRVVFVPFGGFCSI